MILRQSTSQITAITGGIRSIYSIRKIGIGGLANFHLRQAFINTSPDANSNSNSRQYATLSSLPLRVPNNSTRITTTNNCFALPSVAFQIRNYARATTTKTPATSNVTTLKAETKAKTRVTTKASPATKTPRRTKKASLDDEDNDDDSKSESGGENDEKEDMTSKFSTPMMHQYKKAKAEVGEDYILLFRMGDFYEMFFEDAVIASKALTIELTKRGKNEGRDIPMCGIPQKALATYAKKFIAQGIKYAICEQMEDPKEARAAKKAVVRREIVRLVTPGTLTEDDVLEPNQHNYLLAIALPPNYAGTEDEDDTPIGLAWMDLSTGEFNMGQSTVSSLPTDIVRVSPSEILVPENLAGREDIIRAARGACITKRPSRVFDRDLGLKFLGKMYQDRVNFKDFSAVELAASGALMDYVNVTQRGKMPRLEKPGKFITEKTMSIDPGTRKSLELTRTMTKGTKEGSLLSIMDKTNTAVGARTLYSMISKAL